MTPQTGTSDEYFAVEADRPLATEDVDSVLAELGYIYQHNPAVVVQARALLTSSPQATFTFRSLLTQALERAQVEASKIASASLQQRCVR